MLVYKATIFVYLNICSSIFATANIKSITQFPDYPNNNVLQNFNILFLAKLLVSTGSPVSNGVVSEVIDLQNATNICNALPDFPIETQQGTGALLDSNTGYPSALICAGVYSDECFIVGGSNNAAIKLNTQRRFMASMLIDPAILWITG